MDRIFAAVLQASQPEGTTYQYYVRTAPWEPQLRRDAAAFVAMIGAGEAPATVREAGLELLKTVNDKYKLRYIEAKLAVTYDAIAATINTLGWCKKPPPQLLTCSESETCTIADAVTTILRVAGGNTTAARPYSLVTRFMHVCFPETFAAYDSRAGASIHGWVRDVYGAGTGPNSARQRYMPELLAHTDGTGYIGVLRFYRMYWDGVTGADKVDELKEAASALQDAVRKIPGAEDVTLTELDLLDRLLSNANGNRNVLQLV